jgi:hypothetical protein
MASSNPTTGIGVIAYVQATASPVALTSTGVNGQGNGAGTGSTNHPVAQYAVTLSLANSPTTTLTAVLKDVANTTESSSNGNVAKFKAYCTQSAPSRPASTGSPDIVATVGATSGVIVAQHVGQTIVEVQFATFDNTEGNDSNTGNPKDMVYCQIVVTVTV